MSTLSAFIPCHNEQDSIVQAIRSLQRQSVKPQSITVVADGCTDFSAILSLKAGAKLYITDNNHHRKAGALNQALATTTSEYVMVLDGDSMAAPGFIEHTLEILETQDDVGAVGGIFSANRKSRFVEKLQHYEYLRYGREVARAKGRARVITGTAAVFRRSALDAVRDARIAGELPGAGCWSQEALTEDSELTVALKTLGWRCVSPRECVVLTDVMPTWRRLWKQRRRWTRGAQQTLGSYGLTRVTVPYAARMAFTYFGIASVQLLLALTALYAYFEHISISPFWLAVGGVFGVERVVSVWRGGWGARLIAALLIPEFLYDLFQQFVFVYCLLGWLLGTRLVWGTKKLETENN